MGNCEPCTKKREQMAYKVVMASGRVIYRTNDERAAVRISKNYAGSVVKKREDQ